MDTELNHQLFQLIAAVLSGAGLGIMYDGFRILFRRLPMPLSILTDLLYLLLSGTWAFLLAQETAGGFTLFFLLGCGCGIGLYACTLHDPLVKSFDSAERKAVKLAVKGGKFAVRCVKSLKKVAKKMKKYLCK